MRNQSSSLRGAPKGRRSNLQARRLLRALRALAMTTLFAICCLLIAAQAFAAERFFEIKAKKFSYTPNIIKVNKGDVVKIRLISEDVTHGLFIDGYGLNTSAHPGEDGNITFVADKTGRFSFRCSVTCGEFHPYMIGYLFVDPNSRFLIYIFLIIVIGAVSMLLINSKKKAALNR